MNNNIFVIICCFVIVSSSFSIAGETLPDYELPTGLYEDGIKAYRKGNCPMAIKLLGEFRKQNETKLAIYDEFDRKIQEAITNCEIATNKNTHQLFQTGVENRDNKYSGRIN